MRITLAATLLIAASAIKIHQQPAHTLLSIAKGKGKGGEGPHPMCPSQEEFDEFANMDHDAELEKHCPISKETAEAYLKAEAEAAGHEITADEEKMFEEG